MGFKKKKNGLQGLDLVRQSTGNRNPISHSLQWTESLGQDKKKGIKKELIIEKYFFKN